MINSIRTVTATLPRLLVHCQGVGKTTLAAKFPAPVFSARSRRSRRARGIASSPLGVALDLIASGATS
jgi:hypothetical protein